MAELKTTHDETVPIGQVVEYQGQKFTAKESRGCTECHFTYGSSGCSNFPSLCGGMMRADNKSVVWIKVE